MNTMLKNGYMYEQLCGAIGCLYEHGALGCDLHAVKNNLKEICREGNDFVVSALQKKYRRQCLDLGIIEIGQLFDIYDAQKVCN